jgi:large subunit ribosomal protein L22
MQLIKKLREDKMAKPKRTRQLPDNATKAVLRNIRISPSKANLVAGLIRGKSAERALNLLAHSKRRIATEIHKLLSSAIANAENNHSLDIDNLIVKEAYVGKALVMKRWHARGRGRGAKVFKPFSHFTVIVSEEEVAV